VPTIHKNAGTLQNGARALFKITSKSICDNSLYLAVKDLLKLKQQQTTVPKLLLHKLQR
jgi:hypothetical protein